MRPPARHSDCMAPEATTVRELGEHTREGGVHTRPQDLESRFAAFVPEPPPTPRLCHVRPGREL